MQNIDTSAQPVHTTDTFALNNLERLLYRGDSRQTKRQFLRLLKRHWPITLPDSKTYPRLTLFVQRYTAMQAAHALDLSKPFGPADGTEP